MNRYPLWKYLVIAAAMLFGLIYTLPNFFGESPAVQVSPMRGITKVDQGLMKQVEELLKKNALAYQGIAFDASGVKVRFADADAQIKAKDILQSQLGGNFVVALNLLSSSPKWLSSLGAEPMYLGLDLRGGVHFLLQVDMKGAITKALDRYNGDVRTSLREKKIAYTGISRQDQAVEIKFRDAESRQKALDELQKTSPDLLLKEVDEGAEFKLLATLKLEAQKRIQEFALQQNITTLRNRINELGVAEPIIQQQGIDRVVVQLPGVQDTAKAKDILGRTATLEIRMVDEEHDVMAAVQSGQIPFGSELYTERKGLPLLVK